MIRVLRALEVENQQRLQAVEQSKLETEQRSREELTRLNAELQVANQETERLLHELQQHHARRGELLQHITAAQEAERRRIARELHDETGQALTGLAMGLRGIVMGIQEDGKLSRRLSDLESIATTALGELRHLINDLRPPQLDDMGLSAALRWMINRCNERGLLQVELDIQGTPSSLPSEVETTLFRITQEGLNNVIKHAKASHAWVTLQFDPHGIVLTLRDDGIGFDPVSALNPNSLRASWGLVGMQERASLINARLSIQSEPGKGTVLTIELDKTAVGV
jgi:signal transduction histidine kinase